MKKLEDFQSHKIETKSVIGGLMDDAHKKGITKYTDGNGCAGTDLWVDSNDDGIRQTTEFCCHTLN